MFLYVPRKKIKWIEKNYFLIARLKESAPSVDAEKKRK
jgi:hypothetical protein